MARYCFLLCNALYGNGLCLSFGFLFDEAVAVGVEQLVEVADVLLKVHALVGVAHSDAASHHLHDLFAALDVGAFGHSLLRAVERLVLDEFEATAVIDQCVASNARRVVVGFGKTTVDDHQHAVCLDGILALAGMDRNVAVDDVACLALHTEVVQQVGTHLGILTKLIVCAFLLVVRDGIGKEIPLESRHAALVEEWAVGSAPQVPEEIPCSALRTLAIGRRECRAHLQLDLLHQFAAAVCVSVYLHLAQTAVGIEGNGGMEQQIAVADREHRAMAQQATDVFLQFFRNNE